LTKIPAYKLKMRLIYGCWLQLVATGYMQFKHHHVQPIMQPNCSPVAKWFSPVQSQSFCWSYGLDLQILDMAQDDMSNVEVVDGGVLR
jgi:hypothetical protein